MSDLTPGLEPLFPVYSPGCNFVKGYIYETEAKGYKLQGLYGAVAIPLDMQRPLHPPRKELGM